PAHVAGPAGWPARRCRAGLAREPRARGAPPPRQGQRRRPAMSRRAWLATAVLAAGTFAAAAAQAQGLPALTAQPGPDGAQIYSLSVQTLLLITLLTFLPAALLMMTGFTRIIIV